LILANNVRYVSKKLFNLLQNAENVDVFYKLSKDGVKVPFFNNVSLCSSYYPFKESEQLKNVQLADSYLTFDIGFGAGYHLFNISKTTKLYSIVFNYPLIKNILSNVDLSLYFTDNLFLIDISEISNVIHTEYKSHINVISAQYFNNNFTKDIARIKRLIADVFNNYLVEKNTIQKFGYLWHRNIMKNVVKYYDNYFNFDDLAISDKTILITGAGYSLDQNLDFIRDFRDRFYIAATDTSALILLKNKIIPDSIFSFDCQNFTNMHFLRKSKIRVFSCFTSPIYLSAPFTHTLLFSDHPFKNIFEKAGWKTYSLSSQSRNIGMAIVEFFTKYFEEFDIVTVGIDYAIFDDYLYSKNSYLNDIFITAQDFIKSPDLLYSKILYKNASTIEKNNWKTNSYLQSFSEYRISKKVFTISASPFTNFVFISGEELLSKNSVNAKILPFRFRQIEKIYFKNIINDFINRDITPMLPLILSKNIKTDIQDLTAAYIDNYFIN